MNPGQRWADHIAMFWAIAWPAALLSSLPLFLVADLDWLIRWAPWISVASQVTFHALLLLFTPRLTRKNFRAFWVHVIRPEVPAGRQMTWPEARQVWIRIAGVHFLAGLAIWLLALTIGDRLPPELTDGLDGLFRLMPYLVIGPAGVSLAMNTMHPGFRLEASPSETRSE